MKFFATTVIYGCSLLVVLNYKKTCNKIDQENQIVSKDEELYMEEEEKTGA